MELYNETKTIGKVGNDQAQATVKAFVYDDGPRYLIIDRRLDIGYFDRDGYFSRGKYAQESSITVEDKTTPGAQELRHIIAEADAWFAGCNLRVLELTSDKVEAH